MILTESQHFSVPFNYLLALFDTVDFFNAFMCTVQWKMVSFVYALLHNDNNFLIKSALVCWMI